MISIGHGKSTRLPGFIQNCTLIKRLQGKYVMTEIFLEWRKDPTSLGWYELLKINPQGLTGYGVYVIWHSGSNPRAVYIGQGAFFERLSVHQKDERILRCEAEGTLLTTWATLEMQFRDGVERYLIDTYKPLVNERIPNVTPIQVNLLV